MYKLLTLAFILLVCFGCDDDQSEIKDVPDNFEIDLNQDGFIDFEIIYELSSVIAPVDPDPGPYEQIIGKLVSSDNNQILKNEELASILYLNDTNLIQTDTNPPYFWEVNTDENSNIIVSISQNILYKTWPEEWRVNNEEIKNSYLVGFKLSNSLNTLGFFEVSIDNQTGLIDILNIEFN